MYGLVDQPFDEDSLDVFEEGYSLVSTRYIEAVDLGGLAADGLNGMAAIDPQISAQEDNDHIQVFYDQAQVAEFPIPISDIPEELSEDTYDAIVNLRSVSPALEERQSEAIYAAFFDGMISGLDAYTRYASAERARENRAQREGYGGIGIRIRIFSDAIQVSSVMEETPASRAGLRSDDEITHIDGTPTAGLDLAQAVRLLRGPVGSDVRLTITRSEQPKSFDVDVEREHIIPPTVSYAMRGDIAHFQISRFNQRTAESLKEKLQEMRNEVTPVNGIIVDLRDNPGGLLDQSIDVADIFLTEGVILTTHGRHRDSHQRYVASGVDYADDLPIVVLINDHSASAAEIVGAALQDNARAVVMGTTSFGKGTVQTVFRLPNGSELTLTWSRFFAPSGYVLHGLGILPTICTSDHSRPPATLIDSFDEDSDSVQSIFADWRSSVSISDPHRADLRKICPPYADDDDVDFDLDAATLLLSNKVLFQEAIVTSSSQLASRMAKAK
ncbi:MAG: S41 family peptidase [Alphaproteobacteria bacterium]|nr:S41 family peptidase [Alphaproteobacteria bacterium]